MRILLLTSLVLLKVSIVVVGFHLKSLSNLGHNIRNLRLLSTDDSKDLDYDSFLDISRPYSPSLYAGQDNESIVLESQQSIFARDNIRQQESTIANIVNSSNIKSKPQSLRLKTYKNWPLWDEFMETYLSDLDDELQTGEEWLGEARNFIEQKRGKAIWSKKSDSEIQQEIKKAQASKGLYIPPPVVQVITEVFLERNFKMSEYKIEDELACLEFRKWIREQKKKSKKDPLLSAKNEVSNRWLMRHPLVANAIRPTKPRKIVSLDNKFKAQVFRKKNKITQTPQLLFYAKPLTLTVLDDIISFPSTVKYLDKTTISFDNVITANRAFSSSAGSETIISATKADTQDGKSIVERAKANSVWPPLISPSMHNWDKSIENIPSDELRTYSSDDSSKNLSNARMKFPLLLIDSETEMFLPNKFSYDSEYFVAL